VLCTVNAFDGTLEWSMDLKSKRQCKIAEGHHARQLFVTEQTYSEDLLNPFESTISVHSIDSVTGEIEWTARFTGETMNYPPTLSETALYLTFQKHVVALDALTGETEFQFDFDGYSRCAPVEKADVIYFATTDTVFARNRSSLEYEWQYADEDWWTDVVLADDVVYYRSQHGASW
jgi:outer membrane protein assembly factor BamB